MKGDRIVREPERRKITGPSSTTWWRLEQRGEAPKRIQIGPNMVGWLESELLEWVRERADAARGMRQPTPLKEATERRRKSDLANPAPLKRSAKRKREPLEAVP